jgi:dihydrofolate reductase
MRASVFIATSLDGFIARPNGALDWLPGADGTPLPEDHGYDAFIATVDVIVVGSGTWETVRAMPAWPYAALPVRVLTSRPLAPASAAPAGASIEAMSGAPGDILAALSRQSFRHAYVDGGRVIQDFLRAGLIGELTITRVPVLLGVGIPLFGALDADVPLRHVRTRTLAGGLVQSTYSV